MRGMIKHILMGKYYLHNQKYKYFGVINNILMYSTYRNILFTSKKPVMLDNV